MNTQEFVVFAFMLTVCVNAKCTPQGSDVKCRNFIHCREFSCENFLFKEPLKDNEHGSPICDPSCGVCTCTKVENFDQGPIPVLDVELLSPVRTRGQRGADEPHPEPKAEPKAKAKTIRSIFENPHPSNKGK